MAEQSSTIKALVTLDCAIFAAFCGLYLHRRHTESRVLGGSPVLTLSPGW